MLIAFPKSAGLLTRSVTKELTTASDAATPRERGREQQKNAAGIIDDRRQ